MLLQLPSSSRVPALVPTTPHGTSAGAELVTSDGRALALVAVQLRAEAQGGIARLVLEQRFENPYDEILRVVYRMPLPADGAVSGYAFEIGERVVKGVVDRKAAARERFERAIVEGKTAALLEQERNDIFTQQIGNIAPREAVVAKITIDQRLAWLPEGEWELRFPTVIGPRYIGTADTAADVRATHIKVSDTDTGVRLQIELMIRDAITAGATPSSASHVLAKRTDGVIELNNKTRLDRDIVVRWPVAAPVPGLALDTARPIEGAGSGAAGSGANHAYALLTIVPPSPKAKPKAVARDLIVLLDTSGSMSGGPLDKAKQVVAMMIDSLGEEDRLELIEFSNEPRRYKHEPIVATARAKHDAIKWVRALSADGSTEMRAAVIEALQTLRIGAQRQVVLVTDGYVGGEQQILEVLHRSLPKSCRLHVLGVGAAVNRSLATTLARAGRGAEVLVGIDEDAERGAKRLLDRTRQPMLTNVEIAGSALLRHAPEQIPDVFEGAPLVAALCVKADGGELVVRGQTGGGAWEQRVTVAARRAGEGNQAICALYGRERVADVESHAMFDSVNGEIEELGLMFQIATRMTSWVAIDESRRVTGPTRSQLIPQELPYGTSAQAFGLRGATSITAPMQAQYRTQAGVFDEDEKVLLQGALGMDYPEGEATDLGEADRLVAGPLADDEFEAEEPTGQAQVVTKTPSMPLKLGSAPRPAPARPVVDVIGESPMPQKESVADKRALSEVAKPTPPAEAKPMPRPGKYLFGRPATWMYLVWIAILIAALMWWLLK
jgi:Ca-activated chloride channel family protein